MLYKNVKSLYESLCNLEGILCIEHSNQNNWIREETERILNFLDNQNPDTTVEQLMQEKTFLELLNKLYFKAKLLAEVADFLKFSTSSPSNVLNSGIFP